MLLSIAIPTYNRRDLLCETLKSLEQEIQWLPEAQALEIELIVADNSSVDGTREMIFEHGFKVARYMHFDEHVDIAESIARSIRCCTGSYVWVFGDDDYIPLGFLRGMIERIKILESDIAFLYFNRFVVDWKFQSIRSVAHVVWDRLDERVEMADFIRRFSHWPGFVTSMVFRRDVYEGGLVFDRGCYEGWRFLARIYYGGRDKNVLVINYPSLAQRLGVHSWKAHWPRYWLVNMPRLLHDLEVAGVTKDAVCRWRTIEVSCFRVCVDALVAKSFGVRCSDQFWGDARLHLNGFKYLILVAIQWFVHVRLANVMYRFQPKYRN